MPATPKHGDVLIRAFGESSFQLVDATTDEQISIAPDLPVAVRIASDCGGAVWRENLDNRGRRLGSPVLLLPPASLPRH